MAVQSAHVTFVMGAKIDKKINPSNVYFQWIGVDTEKELYSIIGKHLGVRKEVFFEPDIGNKLTSVAFQPILWNKRQDFLEYPLMKF